MCGELSIKGLTQASVQGASILDLLPRKEAKESNTILKNDDNDVSSGCTDEVGSVVDLCVSRDVTSTNDKELIPVVASNQYIEYIPVNPDDDGEVSLTTQRSRSENTGEKSIVRFC